MEKEKKAKEEKEKANHRTVSTEKEATRRVHNGLSGTQDSKDRNGISGDQATTKEASAAKDKERMQDSSIFRFHLWEQFSTPSKNMNQVGMRSFRDKVEDAGCSV